MEIACSAVRTYSCKKDPCYATLCKPYNMFNMCRPFEFRIDIFIPTNQVGCFLGWFLDVPKLELSLHWSYLTCGPTFFTITIYAVVN